MTVQLPVLHDRLSVNKSALLVSLIELQVQLPMKEQDRDLCFRPISTWGSRHTAHTRVRPKREWVTRPSGPARLDDLSRIRVRTMGPQKWPWSKSSSEKREAEKNRQLSTKSPGHDVVVTFTAV
nr:unnamed protein product [Haemonchus contortus]